MGLAPLSTETTSQPTPVTSASFLSWLPRIRCWVGWLFEGNPIWMKQKVRSSRRFDDVSNAEKVHSLQEFSACPTRSAARRALFAARSEPWMPRRIVTRILRRPLAEWVENRVIRAHRSTIDLYPTRTHTTRTEMREHCYAELRQRCGLPYDSEGPPREFGRYRNKRSKVAADCCRINGSCPQSQREQHVHRSAASTGQS